MKRPLSFFRRCLPSLPLHFFWDSHPRSGRKSLRVLPQLEILEDRLLPANITWTGGGTTNNWSDPGNWGGKLPGTSDTVIFNNTSTKAANVDTGFAGTVGAIQINSGYSGTITLMKALADNGSYSQSAGILRTNGLTLSVGSDVSITGGTFSNATGTLNLNGSSSNLNVPSTALGNVTINATGMVTSANNSLHVGSLTLNSGTLVAPSGTLIVAGNLVDNGGTFNANGGTLMFAANAGGHTVNVSGASGATVSLNNLTLADSGIGTRTYTLTGKLAVSGNFSETPASSSTSVVVNGGTIAVLGNVSVGAGANGGTTDLQFDGASAQTYSSTGGILPTVEVANASDTVSATAGTTNVGVQNLTLTNGTFAAPVGTLTIVGNLTQTAGIFNANGGTVVFAAATGKHTITVSSPLPLNNLAFEDRGSGTRTSTLTGTLNVAGNFGELPATSSTAVVLNGGTIAVLGNVSVAPGAAGGTTDLQFTGNAGQTYTATGGTLPSLEINKTSGTVGAASGTTNLAVQNLTLTNGSFTAPTGTMTIVSNLTQSSGSFTANGGTVVIASNLGSHAIHVGSLPLNNLTLADSGPGTRIYTLTGTLAVGGNFSELPSSSSTSVVVNGGTIAVQGNVTVAPGANGGTTDVQFAGTAGQTYTATGGILPVVEIANPTGTVSPTAGTTSLTVQALTLTSGTFVAPSGTLTILKNLSQTSGAINPNGGTVLFSSNSSNHAININGGAAGLLTLNNLVFGDSGSGARAYTIAPGDGFYLDGNFTAQVQAGSTATMFVNGGIFDVTGNTTLGTGYQAGRPAPVFNTLMAGTGAISGAVYDDENGSGQEQSTDPGLFGWTVHLLDSNGKVINTQTTASTGGYSFLNLMPGTYSVQEVTQSGYTATAVPSRPLNVEAGSNVTANFGNYQNITITGTVFNDANGDGQQQLNESGIPHTTVQLYTVTNGQVAANPLQTSVTDNNGNYSFTNLGPLPQGAAYVIAQVMSAGTSQTKPASGSNTITLPDGRIGWLVPATGGVAVNLTGQPDPNISGTGSYTLNKLNNPTMATVKYNDGAGHSGSINTHLSQFNVTFNNGANAPVTFNTFCIDTIDSVGIGGTYSAAVQPSLTPTYVNAGPMAYIFQNFGMPDLSNNPIQAAAVQVALWDLSLNNHTPTQFIRDADGTYSSGDENVFAVNFGSNPNAAAIAALVNQYLHISFGMTNAGAILNTLILPGPHGQILFLPENSDNFANFTPPSAVPGSGCAPPAMLGEDPDQSGNGPVYCPTCNPCVQAATGVADPAVAVFGSGGQDPLSLTIDWSNGSYSAGSNMGSGINNSLTPSIVQVKGTQTLAVLIGGTDALYFDWNGTSYVERFGGNDQLTHNPSTLQYTLVDTMGDQLVFWDFNSSLPVGQRGGFQSITDPGGNITQVTSRTATGQIADMQRSSNGVTESFLYTYLSSGVNAGLVQNVTLRRSTDSGNTWSTVRQAVFTYYDGTKPYGNVGDLQFLTVEDGSSNVLGTNYFRYYTPTDASSGGYVGGLKYFFSEKSYAQLAAAVGNATTASDSQVAPYADDYFQYDASHRLSQAVAQGAGCSSCSAGLGTFTFDYTTSSNAPGYNSWAVKTVMKHPDGSTDTIYSNFAGEAMLDAFTDATTGITTDTYFRYDNAGRVILTAQPSAVTGYNDADADLVNYQNGTAQYLSNNSGLITLDDYYSTTTAGETTPGGAAGYLKDIQIEQGQLGTPVLQESMQYFSHTAGDPITVDPLATDTVYRNTDGTGAETTSYAYTWYPNSVQMQSMTTTLPVISAAQNGPGVADQVVSFFDTFGRDVWDKDADGYISYTSYDPATGAVVKSIQDVNTADTSEFQNLPAGWVTPTGGGLNLTATYSVDSLGRPTKIIDPNGNITYMMYDDVNHEVRSYVGWNSTTGMPTGPTLVYREDWANGYTETLTMSAAPHLNNGIPDGTEPIAGVQTLSRAYMDPAGQLVRKDNYFNLSGVNYSTAPYIGTANTNYYTTTYGYDDGGRRDHVQSPTGTITDMVYDGRGDVLSVWIGTNDTPANGEEWSPTNNSSPANMVEVSSYVYDNGGVGNDNLTQTTEFPGGTSAPRVAQYFYDWRDRLVAEKDGVQASENDGTHRPIFYTTYDNLDEAIAQAMYTGDGVTINTVNGVPQPPDPSLLRAYVTIQFDDQGRVYQTNVYNVNPSTGTVSKSSLTTNYYYNHRGDHIAESDPGGLWTKDVYDGAGRLVTEYATDGGSGPSWADANTVANDIVLVQVQTVYDANSNPIEKIDAQRLPNASGTGALGNPTNQPYARVSYSGTYYDLADRPIADVNVGTNGGTAWMRPSTVPARSDTVLVTSYGYSAAGFQDSTTDPMGYIDQKTFDALGRVTQDVQDYTDGTPTNNSNQITQYTYDGDNNVLTVTAVQPAGGNTPSQTTQYVYGVTAASGSAINSNDLLAATLYPDPTTGRPSTGQQETYTYNALGQVTSRTDRNGNTHEYLYDVLGRPTSDIVTTLGAGVNGSVRRIDAAYDQQGNPYLFTSYADTAGTQVVNQVVRQFNGLDQMTAEYQSVSGPVNLASTPSVQYAYTEMAGGQNNSRLVSMTYPNGRVLNYNYNAGLDSSISRLSSISDNSATLESYKYLGLATVVERDHPQTGINETYLSQNGSTGDAGDQITGLDRFGRVVEVAWSNNATGQNTDDFTYSYDRDSNALTKNNTLNPSFNETYTYNGLNELTGYSRSNGQSQNYGLDALGNMTNVTTNGTTQTRTSNAQNELTSVSGATTPTYDKNGNLTTDETGQTYVWDAWNRLVAVKNSSGTVVESYAFDALNRRVQEKVSGTTTNLYFDGTNIIEERVGGKTTAQEVWNPLATNTLVERDSNPNASGQLTLRLYYQVDANNNVTALVGYTSGSWQVVERYVYLPFGAVTIYDPTWMMVRSISAYGNNWMFQDGRFDATTGNVIFQNRIYRPSLQVWLSNDPIGFAGGTVNLYQMEGNNPVDATDAYGLWSWSGVLSAVAGAAVGIAVGAAIIALAPVSFPALLVTGAAIVAGGAAAGAVGAGLNEYLTTGAFSWSTVGRGALSGAAAALPFVFLPATAGVAAFAAVGALSGAIGYTVDWLANPNAKWDWGDFALSVGLGATFAGFGRYLLSRANTNSSGRVTRERWRPAEEGNPLRDAGGVYEPALGGEITLYEAMIRQMAQEEGVHWRTMLYNVFFHEKFHHVFAPIARLFSRITGSPYIYGSSPLWRRLEEALAHREGALQQFYRHIFREWRRWRGGVATLGLPAMGGFGAPPLGEPEPGEVAEGGGCPSQPELLPMPAGEPTLPPNFVPDLTESTYPSGSMWSGE